jgi:hypothetical protein
MKRLIEVVIAVVVLLVSLSAQTAGSHPNCAGCLWKESTYTWACDQTLQLGCFPCVYSNGGEACSTPGECQNGICVLNGSGPEDAAVSRKSQLTANPWLADIDIAKKMTALSKIPRAEDLVRNQQMYELTTGLSVRMMTQSHDETRAHHLMLRVSTIGGSRVFEFWVEDGATSRMDQWLAAHPEADEKLVITPTTWTLYAGSVVKANGYIKKYEPVYMGSCAQKPQESITQGMLGTPK